MKYIIIALIIIFVIIIIAVIANRPEPPQNNKVYNNGGNRPPYRPNTPPRQPKPQQKTLDQIIRELNDAKDNTAVRDDVFYVATQKTQKTASRVKNYAPTSLNLGIDALMSQVNQLVNYANRIAGNAHPKNFRKGSDNFTYNNNLWYRARMAGVAFLQAADLVQNKLNQLHKIDFKNISSADRQKIKQLQANEGLIALKRDLIECAKMMFRTNKNIKELIRNNCGKGGSDWARKMDESGEEARLEADRKRKYGW